jgi:large subunit ribosomal protein L5
MHYLSYYYNKTLKYELINKFHYHKLTKLPKIKKIILNFNYKTDEIKSISASLLALELLAFQKGVFNTTNKTNLFIKMRKGSPIGCRVTLRKKLLLQFLVKIYMEVFPKIKNFDGLVIKKKNNKHLSFLIQNVFKSSNLEDHYYLFNNLPNFNITVILTQC